MAQEFQPAIDVAALDDLEVALGDDRVALRDLIETYLDDAPRLIGDIRAGVAAGDVEEVHRAAYTLKSTSATVGAEALAAAARELEALTLPASTVATDLLEPEIAALVDVMASEFGRARDELNALVPADGD